MVVAIVGVLAALAIYGVRHYLANAKTAEAKENVGAIVRNAQAAFERETVGAEMLPGSAQSTTTNHALCKNAPPVPAAIPARVKYQPSQAVGVDFNTGDTTGGWACLRFSVSSPIYYQYAYRSGGGYVSQGLPKAPSYGGSGSFEASAQGDLDGDSALSTFARGGEIRNGELVIATYLYINDETE